MITFVNPFAVASAIALPRTDIYTVGGSVVVPAGATSATIHCIGAGGVGASFPGGGGAYAGSTVAVTPGETLTLTIGAGSNDSSGGAWSATGTTPTGVARSGTPLVLAHSGRGRFGANGFAGTGTTRTSGGDAADNGLAADSGGGAGGPGGNGGVGGSNVGGTPGGGGPWTASIGGATAAPGAGGANAQPGQNYGGGGDAFAAGGAGVIVIVWSAA